MGTKENKPAPVQRADRFVLVSDKDSCIVSPPMTFDEVSRLAGIIRRCHGEVTVFEETNI